MGVELIAIMQSLTRQPLGLRATRQPLGGGGGDLLPSFTSLMMPSQRGEIEKRNFAHVFLNRLSRSCVKTRCICHNADQGCGVGVGVTKILPTPTPESELTMHGSTPCTAPVWLTILRSTWYFFREKNLFWTNIFSERSRRRWIPQNLLFNSACYFSCKFAMQNLGTHKGSFQIR